MAPSRTRRAVVIGGGITGISSAYYLAREGWGVTLVERAQLGAGCSHGNCGIIGMSQVLPLNAPGAVRKTLMGMLQPASPFSIPPRFDPGLWLWLAKFALRCSKAHMLSSARVRRALLEATEIAYGELFEQESIECEVRREGSLLAFQSKEAFVGHGHTDALLRAEFGLAADRYEGDALVELEPSLRDGLAGGWHYPGDFHLRPDRLIASWSAVNAKWGVEVREETEVLGIHADPNRAGRASVVVTDKGELEADCVVVATGAMAPLLNKQLGCRLSVQPGKGYSITQPRPEACPNRPVIFAEHKVAATPFEDGYRLGSTMEFTGYDPRIRPARLELLRNADAVYMREASRGSGEEAWFGWRSMTSDGLPIIDRSPRFGNVIVATGHNMLGLTLAPVTGKLVADLAAERKPQLDLQPLRIDR